MPARNTNATREPIILRALEGEETSSSDASSVLIKLGIDELAVTESRYDEGESGPGTHVHHEHVDAFYVLEGQLVFEVEDRRVEVGPDGFVAIPAEIAHTFRNEGPGPARFLNFHAPSKNFHRQLRGEDVDFDSDEAA
jgi:mannose-6-phosphate isomerase-like protein (cupin superfamily)